MIVTVLMATPQLTGMAGAANSSIALHEFSSEKTCKAAAKTASKQGNVGSAVYTIVATCVEK